MIIFADCKPKECKQDQRDGQSATEIYEKKQHAVLLSKETTYPHHSTFAPGSILMYLGSDVCEQNKNRQISGHVSGG